MDTKYDLYITYPTEIFKDQPGIGALIKSTIEHIRISLSRIMNRDIVIVSKGNEFNNDDYRKFLQKSATAVIFVSPAMQTSNTYSAELNDLCDVFKPGNLNNTSSVNRVFKIAVEPLGSALQPACLNDLLSYNFYEKNIYNRKIKSMDFSTSDKSAILYSKLLDVTYDIAATLKFDSPQNFAQESNRSIYLGLTSFDQVQARDDIRRELQHYGFRVLPQGSMPEQGDEFEKKLIFCLEQSDTAIELMGSQYGEILKGTKYSLTDFQNRVIREFQQKNKDSNLRRLIWIPVNNKISDQRQSLYLKRLRRDDASENTEIIESPLETFKTIVSNKLQDTNHTKKVHFDNISSIYLLMEEEQTKGSEELYSALSLSGLKVQVLDYIEQVGIYARHLQALRDCDAVVVYQDSTNSAWLNSKIRDIIKAPGLGKTKPFKKVVLITKLVPDKHLVKLIKSKVEIIDMNQSDSESILNKLISE